MEKTNIKRKRAVKKRRVSKRNTSIRAFVAVTICAAAVIAIAVICRLSGTEKQNEVYAAAESENVQTMTANSSSEVPTGLAGVTTGLSDATPSAGSTVSRFGTSYDDVIVGQRTQTVSDSVSAMDVSANLESAVNTFDESVISLASSAKLMSDDDYENLLQIVEAEAGTEDLKGKILVANVIMNRVEYSEFPNTISDVIYEYDSGVAQFSPVSDGRISQVTPSEETKEAVKQVLEGVDYSEGALFFIQKSAAAKSNVEWFDKNLKKLFKHGVHEFYTYPDDVLNSTAESDSASKATSSEKKDKSATITSTDSSTELVQMAKAE